MPDNKEPTVAELTKTVVELTAELEKANDSDTEDLVKGLESQLDELQKQLDAAQVELAKAKSKADMSDDEKAFMDDMDEEKAEKFLSMSKSDRAEQMKLAKSNDEVIQIEGQAIAKSKVGPEVFAVMKAQADRIKKNEEDIRKANEAAAHAGFLKRADEELGNLPGEAVAKADVLKHVSALPEAVQKTLTEMLSAGDKAIKAAFGKMGHKSGRDPSAPNANAFLTKVAEIRKRDGGSQQQAMQKAQREYPAEFAAYQGQPASN